MTRKTKRTTNVHGKEQQQQQIPVYKQAILRMCQLQLRICSKLIEIHCSKQHPQEPETLKQAARRTILDLHHNDQPLKVIDSLVEILPRDLLNFLRVGIPPWEIYLSTTQF